MPTPRIFFSAGEPSGDLHGANLIRALKQDAPGIICEGFGGERMADVGRGVVSEQEVVAVLASPGVSYVGLDGKQNVLRVYLKYGHGNEKIISGLVRVSTPGRRVYVTHDRIPSILAGMGIGEERRKTRQGAVPERDQGHRDRQHEHPPVNERRVIVIASR